MMGTRRRMLLVSYLFPPVGGSGVQRATKFTKYLPEFGWSPYVLTVKPINYYVYDHSLLADLPESLFVRRTGSLDPLRLSAFLRPRIEEGNSRSAANRVFAEASWLVQAYRQLRAFAMFPDTQAGWIPFAVRNGIDVVRRESIEVIVATIGPTSSAIIAQLISRACSVPYVLDFRDGWTDDPYARFPTALHRRGHAWLERRTVSAASAVTTVSRSLASTFGQRYPALRDRIAFLPNGFDPADMPAADPDRSGADGGRREIVYMGSLYAHHEPSLQTLVAALRLLPDGLRSRIRVTFIGQAFSGAKEIVAAAGLDETIVFRGYVPHAAALHGLHTADAGLLFVRAGDNVSATGKVYEYLMVGRPIVACVEPEGECADALRVAGNDRWMVPPGNARALADSIIRLDAANWPTPAEGTIDQFSRRTITGKLARVLEQVAGTRAVQRPVTAG